MTTRKRLLLLFFVAAFYAVFSTIDEINEAAKDNGILSTQNFYISGIVKKVMPLRDESHGYGTIYLKRFKTNKSNYYEYIFKKKYLFCKIGNDEAIIVTPGINDFKPGDSVIYDTKKLHYQIYKNRNLFLENGLNINKSDGFYYVLRINGYLDFNYYNNDKTN